MGDDEVTAPNPVIVVEVLSPATASVDTSGKLTGNFRVPSIMRDLVIHPTRRSVIHHRRTQEGIATSIVADGQIAMDPPGMVVAIDAIYDAAEAERESP